MHKKLTRFTTVVATIAAASVATLGLASSSTLAGPPQGANTLTPTSGTTSTTFSLTPPSGASCSGPGTASYVWQTYLVDSGVDASTLTFAGGPNPVAGHFVSPLYDTFGNSIVDKSAAASNLITGIPTFSFSTLAGAAGLTAGAYKIGFACSLGGNLEGGHYWETPITVSAVTATSFSYAFGSVPSAPVLSALTAGDTTLSGSFTASASTPATTGFTVTAVPTAGTTVTLPVAAAGAFTLTGLVNGTSYAVTVKATNSVGASAPSNTANGTPALGASNPVTFLTAVPAAGSVALSWTPPTDFPPTGYTIGVAPTVAGAPFTAAAAATGFTVTGLTPGTVYTFTVTPTHAAPNAPTAATITATPTSAQVIIQDITVVRPVGALVLTQRCGVFGALPAEAASAAFPVALGAATATADLVGTAPTTGAAPGGPADPQFASYPYPVPASYPTHCGVDLGTASLITSGANAGQYYTASGRINQVTVADLRDTDPGWTVNGTMSAFTVAGGGSTFSGSYLGWTPVRTSFSAPTPAGYAQTVTAGAAVAPGNVGGLASAQTLASATTAHGIGIASMDARLKLLIPATARNGVYTGTLTFTAI